MDAAYFALRQNLAVGLIHKYAVRGDHVRTENADFVEILHGSRAILPAAVVQFLLHLRHVDQDWRVVLSRQGRGILERFLRAGVDRVRRRSGVNERIVLPFL